MSFLINRLSLGSCLLAAGVALSLGFTISGCGLNPDVKTPEVKRPDFTPTPEDERLDKILKSLQLCDKPDSEQPPFTAEVLANKRVIEDTIETVNIETLDCDGKVIKTSRGPERHVGELVSLEAPSNLPEPVTYFSVENFRTCSTHFNDAEDSISPEQIVIDPQQEPIKLPVVSSEVDHSGKVRLLVTDSLLIFQPEIPARVGNNFMKIRYFGKCLKPVTEDKLEKSMGPDSYRNCAEHNEIFAKDLLIELKVHRPESDRSIQRMECSKKPAPSPDSQN